MLRLNGGEAPNPPEEGVRWTAEQVLALAPDEASRKAGSKLGAPGPWSGVGASASGAVWGLCKGSGSKSYQTVVDTTGPAYKCSCPSRKFPCKHALGLLLLWSADEQAVPAGGAPADWAREWTEARRQRKTVAAQQAESSGKPAPATADPEAARRRAQRRAERITDGTTELEQRLLDLLRAGLATAEQAGYGLWEEMAARMVDAQAPGLASRVRELGAIPASGPGWPVRLLEECALLHLLTCAWQRIDGLPEPLAATVRTQVGLPRSAQGPELRDRWLVLSRRDSHDGKLTTRRVWLYGQESSRTALLLSFGAAGRSPELALPTGLILDAELSWYPGVHSLRAALGERFGTAETGSTPPPGTDTGAALAAFGQALCKDPWLESWPAALSRAIPVPAGEGWQLADAESDSALPLDPGFLSRPGLWRLVALSGGAPVTVFGECGHRGFTPLTAWAEGSAAPVAL
jgi:hypothetical protein